MTGSSLAAGIARLILVCGLLLALASCAPGGEAKLASASPTLATAPDAPSPSPTRTRSPATAAPTPAAPPLEARPQLLNHGPRSKKVVAFTFDADMTSGMLAQLRSGEVSSWYNAAVVRELHKADAGATMFLTGLWTRTYPKEARALGRDPRFELANHSWDHRAWTPDCFGLPSVQGRAAKRAEVTKTAEEIEKVTGIVPKWFRFPGGCASQEDLALVAGQGEQPVGWDVVSGDAFGSDPDQVAQAILDRVRPGSIVVMHLHGGPNAPTTAPALRIVLPILAKQGYRFVTLSELMGD